MNTRAEKLNEDANYNQYMQTVTNNKEKITPNSHNNTEPVSFSGSKEKTGYDN